MAQKIMEIGGVMRRGDVVDYDVIKLATGSPRPPRPLMPPTEETLHGNERDSCAAGPGAKKPGAAPPGRDAREPRSRSRPYAQLLHPHLGDAAISDVDLEFEPGGVLVAIVGYVGCGKSTLSRSSPGWMRPSSGRVLPRGREVGTGPSPRVGYMLQEGHAVRMAQLCSTT